MVEYRLRLDGDVIRFLSNRKRLPPKQFRQITLKIFALLLDPFPPDCKPVLDAWRVDVGEYRILYDVYTAEKIIVVVLIGRRNDDEVYRRFACKVGRR